MAEKTSVDHLNSRNSRKQSMSEENHINRIRTAYSRRLSQRLSSIDVVQYLQNLDASQDNKNDKTSNDNRRKSQRKQSSVDTNHIEEKGEESSNSPKSDTSRKQNSVLTDNENTEVQETNTLTCHSEENSENSLSPEEEVNKTTSQQFDFECNDCFEHKLRNLTSDEEISISKNPRSLKDVVVLKWLHGVSCPLTKKDRSDSVPSGTIPVQILKKPLKNSTTEKLTENIKSSSEIKRSTSPIAKTEKSPAPKLGSKSADINSPKENGETDSTEEIIEDELAAQIHISELGKLQIILDSKIISPENAAILIWIDDVPEEFLASRYHRRLSIVPQSSLEQTRISTTENQSASELQFQKAPKPDVYFPPATILKNIVIVTKDELSKLSQEDENSSFYKQCNISHDKFKLNAF